MLRQIEIEEGEARRTAALMGTALILALAVVGVMLMRGLSENSRFEDRLMRMNSCSQTYRFEPACWDLHFIFRTSS
jgi:hypothetical protein